MRSGLLVILLILFQSTSDWYTKGNVNPDPRYVNNLVEGEGGLLLFGGKNDSNHGFDDLWEWTDNSWKLIGHGATKRWDHSYTFMSNIETLLLFGGRSFAKDSNIRIDLNDTWTYTRGKWASLNIPGPGNRSSHAMAYDLSKQQTLLFGGRNSTTTYSDTWVFNGITWKNLEIDGPSARFGHTLSYDPLNHRTYLFGGHNGETILDDFWMFNGSEWTEIEIKNGPSARMAHAMQFDDKGNALLNGGWDGQVLAETWVWRNNQWQILPTGTNAKPSISHAIGFNSSTNEFIMFGGSTAFGSGFHKTTRAIKIKF